MATSRVSHARGTVVFWRAKNEPLLCKRLSETPEPLVRGSILDVGDKKFVQMHPVYSISRRTNQGQTRNLSIALTEALRIMFGAEAALANLLRGIVCIGDDNPLVTTPTATAGNIEIVGGLTTFPADINQYSGILAKLGAMLVDEKDCKQIILICCAALPASAFAVNDDASAITRMLMGIHGIPTI